MTDIVSQLLDTADITALPAWQRKLMSDAADEIVRLRKRGIDASDDQILVPKAAFAVLTEAAGKELEGLETASGVVYTLQDAYLAGLTERPAPAGVSRVAEDRHG